MGGGASDTLNNLQSVAINTSLLPGAAGAINVGSATLPFGQLFLSGTSSSPSTNNFLFSGVSTGGTRTLTLPDASGTICLNTGNCLGGSGGGANTSLSNLQSVAINSSLLPGVTNSVDIGSAGATFRNGYFGTGLTTPLIQSVGTLNITPGGSLTIGSQNQALTLQGSSSTVITATSGGNTTTVGFNGVATGNVQFNFARNDNPVGSPYTICSNAAESACVSAYTAAGVGSGNFVSLQNSTPGIADVGNLNITGTGIFGTGLTASGGAVQLNTSGTSNTSIGNTTGTLALASNTFNLSNLGAVTGVTGYNQASGSFLQNGGGSFGTGSGAVSLNGVTTIAAGKNLTVDTNTLKVDATNHRVGLGLSGTAAQLLSVGGTTGNFTVNSSGAVVAVGVNAGAGLLQGSAGLTITGNSALATVTASGTYNSNTFTGSALQFGSAGTATIQSASSQALTITGHNDSTWSTDTGNLTVQSASGSSSMLSLQGGSGGSINIGTANDGQITIGQTTNCTGYPGSGVWNLPPQGLCIGSGNSLGAYSRTLYLNTGSAGTVSGNINIVTGDSSAFSGLIHIGTGLAGNAPGQVLIQNAQDAFDSFEVSNSIGNALLTVDTSGNQVTLGDINKDTQGILRFVSTGAISGQGSYIITQGTSPSDAISSDVQFYLPSAAEDGHRLCTDSAASLCSITGDATYLKKNAKDVSTCTAAAGTSNCSNAGDWLYRFYNTSNAGGTHGVYVQDNGGGGIVLASATNQSSGYLFFGSTIGSFAGTGTLKFGVSGSGNVTFGSDINHTISVVAPSTATAGLSLTISAGATGSAGSSTNGGSLALNGGSASASNTGNGGNVQITGGAGHFFTGGNISLTGGTSSGSGAIGGSIDLESGAGGSGGGSGNILLGATRGDVLIGTNVDCGHALCVTGTENTDSIVVSGLANLNGFLDSQGGANIDNNSGTTTIGNITHQTTITASSFGLATNNIDISTLGAITGATGITSSGTINFSGLTPSRFLFTDASSNLASTNTATSLMLASTLSDEQGTGSAVFNTSPSFTTSVTTGTTNFSVFNTGATTVNAFGAASTINIGAAGAVISGNGALTIQAPTTTALTLNTAGAGTVNVGTSNSTTVSVGSSTATAVKIDCAASATTCSFGATANSHTTLLGSSTTTAATTLQSGAGGVSISSTGTIGIQSSASQAINIGTTTTTNVSIGNVGGTLNVASPATFSATLTVTGLSTLNGGLTVTGASTFNGQIISGGTALSTISPNANCGSGCTVSISGNDTAGTITINTGTGVAAGSLATITFNPTYSTAPLITITPITVPASSNFPQYYYSSGTSTFDLKAYNALTDSKTYTFSYHVIK